MAARARAEAAPQQPIRTTLNGAIIDDAAGNTEPPMQHSTVETA